MNLQMKCDCIKTVYETCSKMFNKVSDFQETCQQIGINLDLKIEHCKTYISLAEEKW